MNLFCSKKWEERIDLVFKQQIHTPRTSLSDKLSNGIFFSCFPCPEQENIVRIVSENVSENMDPVVYFDSAIIVDCTR